MQGSARNRTDSSRAQEGTWTPAGSVGDLGPAVAPLPPRASLSMKGASLSRRPGGAQPVPIVETRASLSVCGQSPSRDRGMQTQSVTSLVALPLLSKP